MLRWICPECGQEWAAEERDCPKCAGRSPLALDPVECGIMQPVAAMPDPAQDDYVAIAIEPAEGPARLIPGWVVSLMLAIALLVGLSALVFLFVNMRRSAETQPATSQRSEMTTGRSMVLHSTPSSRPIAN